MIRCTKTLALLCPLLTATACDDGFDDTDPIELRELTGSGSSGGDDECGNGIVDPGEACDYMVENSPVPCDGSCEIVLCGNGVLDISAGESCDFALDGEDKCDWDCTAARCGDGYLNIAAGESCDDGNRVSGDSCDNTCHRTPVCAYLADIGTNAFWRYNVSAGGVHSWESLGALPTPTYTQITSDSRRVYVHSDVGTVHVYDGRSKTWDAPFTSPHSGTQGTQRGLQATDDAIYFSRGINPTIYSLPLGLQPGGAPGLDSQRSVSLAGATNWKASSALDWNRATNRLYVREWQSIGFKSINTTWSHDLSQPSDIVAQIVTDPSTVVEPWPASATAYEFTTLQPGTNKRVSFWTSNGFKTTSSLTLNPNSDWDIFFDHLNRTWPSVDTLTHVFNGGDSSAIHVYGSSSEYYQYGNATAPTLAQPTMTIVNPSECPPEAGIRGMWAWNAETLAQRQDILNVARKKGVNRIYLYASYFRAWTTESDRLARLAELARFIDVADSHCIATELLIESPAVEDLNEDTIGYTWLDDPQLAVAYVQPLIDWTIGLKSARPLAIHLDVEPHTVKGGLTVALGEKYSAMLVALKAAPNFSASALELNVDIPTSYDSLTMSDNRKLHEWIIDRVNVVTLMNYTDNLDWLKSRAQTEVDDAAKRLGARVVIGVETQKPVCLEPNAQALPPDCTKWKWELDASQTYYENGSTTMEGHLSALNSYFGDKPSWGGVAVHQAGSWKVLGP